MELTFVKIAPTWTFHFTSFPSHFGQDVMEEHCSAYGLPTRGIIIAIVATAISRVSQVFERAS